MITGNENLKQLVQMNDNIIPIFEKHGLGGYFKRENIEKIGKFTKLTSLLKSKNIDREQFIATLNQVLNTKTTDSSTELKDIQHNLHFAAMLPCGIRNPFKEFLETHIANNTEKFPILNYLIEGNVNHELSYYPLLDSISSVNELPDVIMASDVNNFFHKPFGERFIKNGVFKTYTPYNTNSYLEKYGYADTNGNFTMYTANMLVMVVDKERLGNRKMPTTWSDLLNSDFENEIIMRGEGDFFCNAIMLPFYKDAGFEAIKILAKNIKAGMHPAEMVKLAGTNKKEGGAIYIMPYFFAKQILNSNAVVVWPDDGAIVSPVFMLIKADKIETHKALLDFLLSFKTGQMMANRYFPSIHPEVSNDKFPQSLKWLGWDFLNNNDIGNLKNYIRDVFMSIWSAKKIK